MKRDLELTIVSSLLGLLASQSAVAQVTQNNATSNATKDTIGQNNATSNATVFMRPGGLLDGGLVVQDPSGDDRIYKNCIYRSETYSPGSTVLMPNPSGAPGTSKFTCGSNGEWY